jgi:SHS2 domain-containing protein
MSKLFDFLEHTSDAYIMAYGKTLEEAFENAARATFTVMTDVEKIEPRIENWIEVSAHDEYALLYNWLEELIVKFDTTGVLYSRFHIVELKQTTQGYKLKAKVWGEPFVSEKHIQKVGVKGVTYHLMEINKKTESVSLKFLLDI